MNSFTSTFYLRQIRVQIDNTLAEALHILREQLIGIRNAIVQIGHLVVGEAAAVLVLMRLSQGAYLRYWS